MTRPLVGPPAASAAPWSAGAWVGAVALALATAAMPLAAQNDVSQPDGFRVHGQIGSGWSTLRDVTPFPGQTFSSRRGAVTSLRVSRRLAGPLGAFVELGTAARGSNIQTTGSADTQYRTRWFDGALGVNVALGCVSLVCPSLDLGGVLGYVRDGLLVEAASGRPNTRVSTTRYETSALLGVRLLAPRLRSVAVLVRWQEGLTDLPTDQTTGKSRSVIVMLAVPLTP